MATFFHHFFFSLRLLWFSIIFWCVFQKQFVFGPATLILLFFLAKRMQKHAKRATNRYNLRLKKMSDHRKQKSKFFFSWIRRNSIVMIIYFTNKEKACENNHTYTLPGLAKSTKLMFFLYFALFFDQNYGKIQKNHGKVSEKKILKDFFFFETSFWKCHLCILRCVLWCLGVVASVGGARFRCFEISILGFFFHTVCRFWVFFLHTANHIYIYIQCVNVKHDSNSTAQCDYECTFTNLKNMCLYII